MGLLSRVFRRSSPQPAGEIVVSAGASRRVSARYDVAQTTPDNRVHWAAADSLGPIESHRPEVRRIIRERARYEVGNNATLGAMVDTAAFGVVGPCPRLQIPAVKGIPGEDLRAVEALFGRWAKADRLGAKLRLGKRAQIVDGESFGRFHRTPTAGILLSLEVIETERVTSDRFDDPHDGIRFDERTGRPVSYSILVTHPGDGFSLSKTEQVPAEQVVHIYRPLRPGQTRGISVLTPALGLFAEARRVRLAVTAALETAADAATVLQSTGAAHDEDTDLEPFDEVPFDRRLALTLPRGWQLGQVQAEHPQQNYIQFHRELLLEAARCLSLPANLALGNSSGYNYSSGRLDFQDYDQHRTIERDELDSQCLSAIFSRFMAASRLSGMLPASVAGYLDMGYELTASWLFSGRPHVDPVKETTATKTELEMGTLTYAQACAAKGQDWEEVLAQRAAEREKAMELGLSIPGMAAPAADATPDTPPEDDEDEAQQPREDRNAAAA